MTVQRMVLEGWLPEQIANGPHGHWTVKRRKLHRAALMAYTNARAQGWEKVRGKARMEIVLVFGTARRRDTDNLYARVKGLVDGLKPFLVDDSTEWLDLHVSARVERKRKAVEVELEGETA